MIIWHIRNHNSISANHDIISNSYITENLGSRANINIISNSWRTRIINMTKTNHNTITNTAVITEARKAANHNPTKMIDNKTLTHNYLTREFHTCNNLN